jgi:tetratricopeptide (TPR) repeat protein
VEQADDRRLQREALGGRVLGLLRSGLGDDSRREANELRILLRENGPDDERLSFLTSCAAALENDALDRLGAEEVLREAQPLIDDAQGPVLAEALTVRAIVLSKAGAAESAVGDAERAVELAQNSNDAALQARAHQALGAAVGIARSAREGMEILEDAVERAHAADLPGEEASLRRNLGYLAELAGDMEASELHARLGLEIRGAPSALITAMHHNLGSTRQDQGDLDGALAHLLAAQRVTARGGLTSETRTALMLAFAHISRGELPRAPPSAGEPLAARCGH